MGTLVLALHMGVQAQVSLSGTVTSQGRPVRNARITLVALGLTTLTDSLGQYHLVATTSLSPDIKSWARRSNALPIRNTGDAKYLSVNGRWHSEGWAREAVSAIPRYGSSNIQQPGLSKVSGIDNLKCSARGYHDTVATVANYLDMIDIALMRDTRRHMWIWGSTVATVSSERDSLFAFASLKNIGTFYLDCGGIINNTNDVLGKFIDSAHTHGFAVELLFGSPAWTLTSNHGIPVGIAQKAVTLVQNLLAQGRPLPTSIQMDVEPYSLTEWTTDENGTANQLIDMYEKIAAVLKGSGLGISACIPRWFDGRMVTRSAKTRPLSDWLADTTDRLTLMDYVDNAASIIADAAHEVAYADTIGKEVVIGVETIPGLQPPSVTFAEEGEAAMNAALALTITQFQSHASFYGVAIHHWRTYPSMKP